METPVLGGSQQCQLGPSIAGPARAARRFPPPLFHLSMLSHPGR